MPDVIKGARGEAVAEVTLTSQQVKALAASPITIVPAPGAGVAVVATWVHYALDRNAAYDDAASDGDLTIEYATTGTAIITTEADGFIDAAADAGKYEPLSGEVTPLANEGLAVSNSGAEFTGDASNLNTLRVVVGYRLVPISPLAQ